MEANKTRTWILFGALLAGSFLVRLIRINQGLWYDEIHTLLRFVTAGWKEIVTSLPVPNNHILYSLLAKVSIRVFGLKEWAIRLPSFLIGGITPAVLYLRLRKRLPQSAALMASAFMVLSFWMTWFSQDARGYAGWILFAALSNLLYLDWLEQAKARTALWYVLVSVVSFYFFLYTGFIILSQIIYGLIRRRRKAGGQKPFLYLLPLLPMAVALGLYAPGLEGLYLYSQTNGRDISGRWLDLNFLQGLIKMLAGTHWVWFGILVSILFLAGLYRISRDQSGLAWLYLLPAALIILATASFRVFIYPRFLSFLIPFFLLGAASGIELINQQALSRFPRLRKKFIPLALSGLISAFLLISLGRYYQLGKQGLQPAARYLSRTYPDKDVASIGLSGFEYLYYDQYAHPYQNDEFLSPADLFGKMAVATHPWDLPKETRDLLKEYCVQDKVYLSAAGPENNVYLYRCFKDDGK